MSINNGVIGKTVGTILAVDVSCLYLHGVLQGIQFLWKFRKRKYKILLKWQWQIVFKLLMMIIWDEYIVTGDLEDFIKVQTFIIRKK